MTYTGLRLRNATDDDALVIWELANDPLVRAMSFLSKPIPWEEHVTWFQRQLGGEHAALYIVENGKQDFLGNVRFAIEGNTARISIALASLARGGGLAAKVIEMACGRLFEGQRVDRVQAFIRPDNTASIRAFLKAGFERTQETFAHGEPAILFELCRRH